MTVKPVMALPPLLSGGVKLTVAWPLPAVALTAVGGFGTPAGVTLFDGEGNILAQEEPVHSGAPMLPVNWRGDGQEFCLLSGNVKEGGMIDGRLRRVVMFPDDGHPELAAAVLACLFWVLALEKENRILYIIVALLLTWAWWSA